MHLRGYTAIDQAERHELPVTFYTPEMERPTSGRAYASARFLVELHGDVSVCLGLPDHIERPSPAQQLVLHAITQAPRDALYLGSTPTTWPAP